MVEADYLRAKRPHLSNPQTKRGYGVPLMMTTGNTHVVYGTHDNLVFRGRNGAPDFVYQDHRKVITAVGHMMDDQYAFGDETGMVVFFKFTAEGEFSLTVNA